ncbi:hypothetical protein K474DRAFT_1580866, partial [Panus rudis PR-1116 ss-1]
RYQKLTKKDLAASTAVVDPNTRGQRNEKFSWIWHVRDKTKSIPAWMSELDQVNWLRAKARWDRWAEEKILMKSEMEWTRNFFRHSAEKWEERTYRSAHDNAYGGATVFAWREVKTWRLLEEQAE